MELKEGTSVYTPDGREVGHIKRFVLDPGNNKLTHIVVEKGWLFKEDRVVPVEFIDSASTDRVQLSRELENYDDLPPFEELHYVDAHPNAEEQGQYAGAAPASYWYPPMGYLAHPTYGPNIYSYSVPPVTETTQNIPESTVALKEGSQVISVDGQHVGDLERLFVDTDSNQVTHFVTTEGTFLKDRKLVPAQWVRSVEETKVHLTVAASLLDRLPAFDEQAAQRE